MINIKNSKWIIAYDLNVKAMKEAEYSKSKVTQYYNTMREILTQNGFQKFTQHSMYCSESKDALKEAYQAINDLRGTDDPQFVNRLHLFRAENFTDLRSLLPELKQADIDPIKTLIDEMYPEDEVNSNA